MQNIWAIVPEALPQLYAKKASSSDEDAMLALEKQKPNQAYVVQNGVAVLSITGALSQRPSYGGTTYKRIAARFDQALADNAVHAILFQIDSPGGTVAGCKELADHIAQNRHVKPMASYVDGLCASAAYWLASATGTIFAPLTASVGSIGVVVVHADYSEMYKQWGISYRYITGGQWKAVGNSTEPLKDTDLAYLQARVEALHTIFKTDVAKHMNLSPHPECWGEGQLFLASEAATLGLISATVSGLTEALQHVKKDSNMTKEEFFANYPDLAAQLELESKAVMKKSTSEVRQTTQNELLQIAKLALGEEAHNTLHCIIQANISSEQLQSLSSIISLRSTSKNAAQEPSSATRLQEEILAKLQHATPSPLCGANGNYATDEIEAKSAINRMAAM